MSITLDPVKVSDASNCNYITPITLLFFTRARTSVNGEVFRLGTVDNTTPIIKRYDDCKNLKIRFQRNSPITLNIQWVPVNVGRLKQEGQSDPLRELLLSLYRSGIDIRIVLDHDKVTHLLVESDNDPSLELCNALARETVIVGPGWPKYVSENVNKVDRWIRDPEDVDRCFPITFREDRGYFKPNHRRSTLFTGVVVMAYEDTVRPSILEKCIVAMGGTFKPISIATSSIEYVSNEINKTEPVYVYQTAAFAEETVMLCTSIGSEFIDLTTLLGFLADINIDDGKRAVVNLTLKDSLASVSPKKKRLGLRKSKRVDPLEFFDFTQVRSQMSPKEIEAPTGASADNETSNKDVVSGKHSIEEDDRDVKRTKIENIVEPHKTHEDSTSQSSTTASDLDSLIKIPVEEETETSAKRTKEGEYESVSKKPKLEDLNGDRDQVSFRDAVRKAKESAINKVREGLGISQNATLAEIDVHVSNLAIVEETNLIRDRERASHTSTMSSWVGRKNYKKFKRNLTPKSKVHRSFVGVVNDDDQVVISRPEMQYYNFDNEREKNRRLVADFDGEMGSVRVERADMLVSEENGLFVSEDSQSQGGQSAVQIQRDQREDQRWEDDQLQILQTRSVYYDVDDDDDDEDDGPKFGFRRR